MSKHHDIIGATFVWSGMAWLVLGVEGEQAVCERASGDDGRGPMRWHVDLVRELCLATAAIRPEDREVAA